VLLDLNLPGTGGLAVLRRLRALPGLTELPVVIFTSSASESDRAECLDAGATAFLTKPADLDSFVEAVRSAVLSEDEAAELRRAELAAVAAVQVDAFPSDAFASTVPPGGPASQRDGAG